MLKTLKIVALPGQTVPQSPSLGLEAVNVLFSSPLKSPYEGGMPSANLFLAMINHSIAMIDHSIAMIDHSMARSY